MKPISTPHRVITKTQIKDRVKAPAAIVVEDLKLKIPVTKFEQHVVNTPDHIYYGILKREFGTRKLSVGEWKALTNLVKERKITA
jgi:hypothetical protein